MPKRITRKRAIDLVYELDCSLWDNLCENWEANEENELVSRTLLREDEVDNNEVFGGTTDENGQSWATVTVGRYQYQYGSRVVDLKTGKTISIEDERKSLGLI